MPEPRVKRDATVEDKKPVEQKNGAEIKEENNENTNKEENKV